MNREHAYQHSLFFGNDSEEWERTAERCEILVKEMIEDIDETSITMEPGEPVELCFCTPDKLSEFDQGRIVQATQPESYAFNTPETR